MEPYKDAFYSLFQLTMIAVVVLLVSTASCECSFSTMRLVNVQFNGWHQVFQFGAALILVEESQGIGSG